jgi:cleavage stimulation factor subunit 2
VFLPSRVSSETLRNEMASDGRKVFVGNISFEVNHDAMLELFSKFGPVVNLTLHPDSKGRGLHRGSGIVEFSTVESANQAVASMNEFLLGGRPLRVTSLGRPSMMGSSTVEVALPTGGIVPGASGLLGVPVMVNRPSMRIMADPSAPSSSSSSGGGGIVVAGSTSGGAAVPVITEAMPETDLWKVLCEAKAVAETDPGAFLALLEKYPSLTQALLSAGNTLGMVSHAVKVAVPEGVDLSAGATLPTGSAPASVRAKKPLLGGAPTSGSSSSGAVASSGDEEVDPRLADDPRLSAEGGEMDEQRAVIEQILSMPEASIQSLPSHEREQVQTVRDALLLPLSQIQAFPADRRDMLLRTRTELQGLLGHH